MSGGHGRPENAWTRQCPACGKRAYSTRKEARRAARAISPSDALRAYQCGDVWHIGHTPRWVKQGKKT